MRSILPLLLFISLLALQCSKDKDLPSCVNQRIAEIMSQPKGANETQIEEYIYKGEHVFLFISSCCDKYNILYDGSCSSICAPSGGITGGGDHNCTNFFNEAKLVKIVWKDPR